MNDDTMKAADTPHDTLRIRSAGDTSPLPSSDAASQSSADEIFIDLRGNLTHTTDESEE